MPKPDADPHGNVDFNSVENPHCIDLPGISLKVNITLMIFSLNLSNNSLS